MKTYTRIPYGFAYDTAIACAKTGEPWERIGAALCRPGGRNGRPVYLDLSAEEREELRAEAAFRIETYVDLPENAGLIVSARAMLRSLGPPAPCRCCGAPESRPARMVGEGVDGPVSTDVGPLCETCALKLIGFDINECIAALRDCVAALETAGADGEPGDMPDPSLERARAVLARLDEAAS